MAFCTECGHQLEDGAKFCFECGAKVKGSSLPRVEMRKTVYDGEIHKCPNCGEILDSFVPNCPSCGYELRGASCTSAVHTLTTKLEQLESNRPPKKRGNFFTILSSGGQLDRIDTQKVELIRNFCIPNTKEDIREFIILASSNIETNLYGIEYHSSQYQGMVVASQKAVSDAWLAKLEQAVQKAEILFGQTQEFYSMRNLYEEKIRAIRKRKYKIIWLYGGIFGGFILFFIFLILLIALL